MFSGRAVRETSHFAMLLRATFAKHTHFARFAAAPGLLLAVLGGLRIARTLLLERWQALRRPPTDSDCVRARRFTAKRNSFCPAFAKCNYFFKVFCLQSIVFHNIF